MPPVVQDRPTYWLGIDPGNSSGGAALLNSQGLPLILKDGTLYEYCWMSFKDSSEHEIGHFFEKVLRLTSGNLIAVLEKVWGMQGQAANPSFNFGASYGLLKGLLIAHKIRYENPAGKTWQTKMGCKTDGDKNISKAKAHSLWPKHAAKITHAVADALLLAEYGRRFCS